ncbi:MFS transporter [Paenibacillus beijingensis]|uniref:MFS transporter n=1 Tax=Paenibacillus beijingensis TaxID=1126833 RepID=A0A0D5NIX7_9BACL|nr:MFS transporter [Paenibacillus beijingensis]AJY75211.1 MFS transporter [Paenibacillus beijingensis]
MNAVDAVKTPSLFANRFFQTILLSNVMLQIGIWVRNFAILMHVADKTNEDPLAISLISVAEFAPIFIFSFIGGTFADRWRPKRTMIWCDLLSAVSVFVVLLTLLLEIWQAVFFVTLVSAILSQFSQPSAMRLFKVHVPGEQLQQSMALFQSLVAVFMVVGPALGVFVYQQFDISWAVAIMGIAFLLSGLVLFRLPADKAEGGTEAPPQKGQFRRELSEGVSYILNSPVLKPLGLTFILAGIAVGISQSLGLFVVTERLDKPKEFLQFMMIVNGSAMLLGGGVIAVIAKKISPQQLLALGMLVEGLCTIGIGFSQNVALTMALQFLAGFFFPTIHIAISTMILKWSDESVVGRVNGILNPLFVGTMTVMMLLAGMIKSVLPLQIIFALSGAFMLIGMTVLIPLFWLKAPESEAGAAQPH